MNKLFQKVLPRSSIGQMYVGFVGVCAIISVVTGVTDAVLDRVLDR